MPKIDIGDAEIYYEEHGEGPPLMLVPGLGGGGSFWEKQVPALARHFRVIIHDHRGAGQSTHSLIRYSVDQMAADTIKLMDGLDIGAAHYVGHSTGGAMGQTIAQDHPDRLLSLVLSATWAGKDAYFRRCFEMRKEVLEKLGLESYSRASMLVLMPAWWTAENDERITEQSKTLAVNNPPVEVMISRIEAIMEFDRRAGLSDIRAPTLVIAARDDNVTPIHLSDELARSIAGAEQVTLERGSHFVPVILPDDYNPPVLDFLRRQAGV
jgi:aminoacrylate hydrolase